MPAQRRESSAAGGRASHLFAQVGARDLEPPPGIAVQPPVDVETPDRAGGQRQEVGYGDAGVPLAWLRGRLALMGGQLPPVLAGEQAGTMFLPWTGCSDNGPALPSGPQDGKEGGTPLPELVQAR